MNRRGILLFLVCAWLGSTATAGARTLPVVLHSFVGLPSDSLARGELLDAFRRTMDAELPLELKSGDAWSTSGPRPNPFRLVDAVSPEDAWTLDLSLGLPSRVIVRRPPPKGSKVAPRPRVSEVRASRGLLIAVTVQPPGTATDGAQAVPVRFAVYFADARRILVPNPSLPGGGYDFPWADAGQIVARAALEVLSRASGELQDDERADLEPATRADDTQ